MKQVIDLLMSKNWRKHNLSFTDKIIKSRTELLRIVTGKNAGKDAWWIVRVDKSKFEHYKNSLKSPSINLSEFGDVLAKGWGKNPPQKVIERFSS